MILGIDWGAWVSAFTALAIIGGVLLILFRQALAKDFTPASSHAALEKRVVEVEQRLALIPTHADMKAVTDRVASVERGVAVVQTSIDGVRESIARVEHMTDLLVKHQLEGRE